MNNEHQAITDAFENLQKHPFTLISLSDREKFHTGMLAFMINKLDQSSRAFLIEQLWGLQLPQQNGEIVAEVEWQSIDLIVRQNTKIVLWAEAKFKTTLSRGQIQKYKDKLPKQAKDTKGILFALFTGVDPAAGGIDEVAFHDVIIDHQRFILAHLEGDYKILLRLWIQYLEQIQVLTQYIARTGINSVGWAGNSHGSFSDNLYKIKLKGIFEHYRHALFRKEVEKLITKENCTLIPNQFNSHGNAGVEYDVYPFDGRPNHNRTLDPKDANGHMRYGMQWQAGSLKLSIDVEQDNFYSEEWAVSKNLNLGDVRRTRAGKLKALHEVFVRRDWAMADLRQEKNLVTKFKSYTIEKWDIFKPQLRDEPATLQDLAKTYVDRLNYLMNQEIQKFVRDEIKELPV